MLTGSMRDLFAGSASALFPPPRRPEAFLVAATVKAFCTATHGAGAFADEAAGALPLLGAGRLSNGASLLSMETPFLPGVVCVEALLESRTPQELGIPPRTFPGVQGLFQAGAPCGGGG